MLRFVSKALLNVFVDKQARTRLEQARAGRMAATTRGIGGRTANLDAIEAARARVVTPEREELLRNAMRVRAAKEKILDDLNDEQKRRLYAAAVKALLNEGRGNG
jgi:hypothetical protein